jgi:hypothetical protein
VGARRDQARDGGKCRREFCWLRRGCNFGVKVLILTVVVSWASGGMCQRSVAEPDEVDGMCNGVGR